MAVGVDDPCLVVNALALLVLVVKVNVAVDHVGRLIFF